MRHVTLFIVVAGLGITASGCGVLSEHPLSDPRQAKPEPKLAGTWFHPIPKDKPAGQGWSAFLHVGRAGPVGDEERDVNFESPKAAKAVRAKDSKAFLGLMRAVWVQRSANGSVVTGSWIFFPTRVGDHWYVNIPFYREDGTREGYRIARFDLSGDKLVVWLGIPSKQCKDAIVSGKVKGVVPKSGAPRLTDSSENLRHFLKNGGDKLLFPDKEKIVFRRVKP